MHTSFLLVSLSMDAILAGTTVYQRRQALDRVTNGLGFPDAYDQTLDRIRQQGGSKSKLGMAALMWVSRSEQPLRLQELLHALGVEVGAEDFNISNIPSIRAVLGSTLGLVIIDNNASTVRLLHFTLKKYLRQHPTIFVTADSMMAEICLTYLNYPSVRVLPNPDNAQERPPFLEYATCFWGTHAGREVTEPVKSLSLHLLDGYENHVSAAILWREKLRERHSHEDVLGISGLHCIAFWGIAEIAIAMLEGKKWDVNAYDSKDDTPLMWAIRYGHYKVVELLLEQGDIRPDVIIRDGRTVFSFAAESGNEHAIKLPLESGNIDPDLPDSNGRTPLSFAASGGHEGVVKLLLERGDVNPNSLDNNGQTPLLYATMMGREGIVNLLSEARTPNRKSLRNSHKTPASVTESATSWPHQKQPPPSEPSSPDRFNSLTATSVPIPTPSSSFLSYFLFEVLIQSTVLLFLFLISYICGDSCGLFHVGYNDWK